MRRGRDCRCGPCCPGARRPPPPFCLLPCPWTDFRPLSRVSREYGAFFLALTKLVSGFGLALNHLLAKASSKARRCHGRQKGLILFPF